MTGIFAPTFRKSEAGPYDHKSSSIFVEIHNVYIMLGILTSKLQRYLQKAFVNSTVEFGVDDMGSLPIPKNNVSAIEKLVKSVICKQQLNPRYDYASHEQIEIDKIVYDAYGLNDDDINEVETWYARRYPKLAAAQRSNIEKLRKA